MAAAQAAAAAAAAASLSDCSLQQQQQQDSHSSRARISFPQSRSCFLGHRIDRGLSTKLSHGHSSSRPASCVPPVSEVAVDNSTNAATIAGSKLEVTSAVENKVAASAAKEKVTASAFMADVANLIKLVDSRDIIELEIKNSDCEILIRKKEALPPPPVPQSFPSPQFITQAPFQAYAPPTEPAPFASTTSVSASTPAPVSPPPAPVSQLPPMLSPMAGTFYRSPAPGEPSFVQVGDRVQKGQVVCIVEAMKLMNEIEADQTGTIVDMVAEDGKPISVDSPLFVIKP